MNCTVCERFKNKSVLTAILKSVWNSRFPPRFIVTINLDFSSKITRNHVTAYKHRCLTRHHLNMNHNSPFQSNRVYFRPAEKQTFTDKSRCRRLSTCEQVTERWAQNDEPKVSASKIELITQALNDILSPIYAPPPVIYICIYAHAWLIYSTLFRGVKSNTSVISLLFCIGASYVYQRVELLISINLGETRNQ